MKILQYTAKKTMIITDGGDRRLNDNDKRIKVIQI